MRSIECFMQQPANERGEHVTISVSNSSQLLSVSDVSALPTQAIDSCWNGIALPQLFKWSLARDPKTLWFVGTLPALPDYDSTLSKGEFVEGLWERDVVELFIKESSGRYQEFNISPAGAWWTVLLNSYRTRAPITKRPQLVALEVVQSKVGWSMVFGVEISSLEVSLEPDSLIHVSGIMHKPRQRFLSSNRIDGIEPDFHAPGCFQPIAFVLRRLTS